MDEHFHQTNIRSSTMYKEVKYLIPSAQIDIGGIMVKQALPTQKVNQVDPFLLLHHANFKFRNDALAKHQGIGPHPHRGFSPVTFVLQGEVHHQDSRGNNQIATKGEVQWMHAGAGIVHSERPSQNLVDQNGRQEIIQLWINTPSTSKMKPPQYQYLSTDDIISWKGEGAVYNRLIAGEYKDKRGNIETESELVVIWSDAPSLASESYEIPISLNTMVYITRGEVTISGFGKVVKEELIVFENNDEAIKITATTDAQFLILAGKPLNEKLVQQGPFVMNSETEILEAMRDYQMGKMGILIEQ